MHIIILNVCTSCSFLIPDSIGQSTKEQETLTSKNIKMKQLIFFLSVFFSAYAARTQTVAVLNIDAKGLEYDPAKLGSLVRIELTKLQLFNVFDKYDMEYLAKSKKADIDSCYSKTCLVQAGQLLGADKMLGGNIEKLGKKIVVAFKWIDVQSGTVEKLYLKEYLDYPGSLSLVISSSLKELFQQPVDALLLKRLTSISNPENIINNPYSERLKLSGPRLGFTYLTGNYANRLAEPKTAGGFEASPALLQFGYQFETQYLNEGNYQGLIELIPLISGLNEGLAIPSITLLNGLRNNKNGWEFAFGPTLSLVPQAEGYFDGAGKWQLLEKKDPATIGFPIQKRIDSRSDKYAVNAGFVLAVGKSLRSGKLNIPFNAYVIPSKEGTRIGFSMGFNGKKQNELL
jgi:hypothetical protein